MRHPPRQARSRDSERRLLAAARALLGERAWKEITVATLCARAGLAVGAFYARFDSKEALFRHLERELFESSRTNVARLAARAGEGAAPDELLRELVAGHIGLYRAHAEVARAVVARAQGDAATRERLRDLSRETYAAVARTLEAAGLEVGEGGHAALEFALYAERSVLREAILFGEGWSKQRRWSDARIGRETVRLLARYLGLDDRPSSLSPARRRPRPRRARSSPASKGASS